MNILTISTLFDRGGAAYIGRTLHYGLSDAGYQTKYLVGYGARGFKQKNSDPDIIYADYNFPLTPHANFILHRSLGKDFFSPSTKQIHDLVDWSDVIICHTIHSHFLNFETLGNILKKFGAKKKVIMVAHDSWHYTGRCAFRFDCSLWQSGCISCPNQGFYPASLFSITKSERVKKIATMKSIPNLTFVSPAKWICDDLKATYPNIPVKLIRNGIETEPYKNFSRTVQKSEEIQLCVSSLSLSQKGKVDLDLVKKALDAGIKIHFIGKDNPFTDHENSISHGYITDKTEYLSVLFQTDGYLFSSSIDIYPTVLVDALCAGSYIFYTPSSGAFELMKSENKWSGTMIQSVDDLVDAIRSDDFLEFKSEVNKIEMERKRALAFFHKNRMVNDYISLLKDH